MATAMTAAACADSAPATDGSETSSTTKGTSGSGAESTTTAYGSSSADDDRPVDTGAATTDTGDHPPPPLVQPNLLLILTDDQRADTLACMPKVQQHLADHGIRFDRMYATTPLCCPSRSTILTGEYAHNHGVRTNNDAEDSDAEPGEDLGGADVFRDNGNEEEVVARYLKEAGYTTGFFGKYMNGYERDTPHVPPHWDRWQAKVDGGFYDFVMVHKTTGEDKELVCYRGPGNSGTTQEGERCEADADRTVSDGENHSDEVQKELLLDFVKDSVQAQTPFFAHLSLKAPHGPAIAPRRYQEDADEFAYTDAALERLEACPLWDWADRPPSYFEEDVSDKPLWVSDGPANAADIDEFRRRQLASLLHVDDAVAEIVDTLDSLGALDDTVIVFTADNGYMWGEHGREKKNCPFEECARLPMVVRHPHAPAGTQLSSFVQTVDLFPTFLELAGVAVPPELELDGTSFAKLLNGTPRAAPEDEWPRDAVFVECWPKGHMFAAVRTQQWKFVEYYEDVEQTVVLARPDGTLERELYDMQEDPYELDNLLRLSPAQLEVKGHTPAELDAIVAELDARLAALQSS